MSTANFIFKTRTGSVYEVDTVSEEIRRLEAPSSGQTQRISFEWRPFAAITHCRVGESAWIFWPSGVPLLGGSPKGCLPMTVTSEVVEVFDLTKPAPEEETLT